MVLKRAVELKIIIFGFDMTLEDNYFGNNINKVMRFKWVYTYAFHWGVAVALVLEGVLVDNINDWSHHYRAVYMQR